MPEVAEANRPVAPVPSPAGPGPAAPTTAWPGADAGPVPPPAAVPVAPSGGATGETELLAAAAEPAASGGDAGAPSGPEMFGPYRLEELIGRGGMGEIHRAYDTAHDRRVALKRLPPSLAGDPVFRARFRTEAALAARLHEPHIIPIHDYGEIDGQLYLDMRLVEGPDLATLLRREGPLPPARAVGIATQVGAALDAAHANGLVHRDIKPGNVLVTDPGSGGRAGDDFVYVTDFGIARAVDGGTSGSLTSTGTTVGSLDYVAPERFGATPGDHRADVYALGCLLHEALTGQRPFPVQGLPALINAHLSAPPPVPSALRPGLPRGLDAVVARALAKDPDQRFPTAGSLAESARNALLSGPAGPGAARPVAARAAAAPSPLPVPPPAGPPPGPAGTSRGGPQRRSTVLTALAVVATVLVLGGALVTTQLVKPAAASSTVDRATAPATGSAPTSAPAPGPAATSARAAAAVPDMPAPDAADPMTVTVAVPVPGDPPDPVTVPVVVPGPPGPNPGPVQKLASAAHNDSGRFHVDTTWQPPADLVGDTLVGYEVTATSPAGTAVLRVSSARLTDRDTGRNCAHDLTYTVHALAQQPGSASLVRGDGALVRVKPVLDCTPTLKVAAKAAGGKKLTVTVTCAGAAKNGNTRGTLAVLVDGVRRWTHACTVPAGGSVAYTATITGVAVGAHRVIASATSVSGTHTAGPVTVTAR